VISLLEKSFIATLGRYPTNFILTSSGVQVRMPKGTEALLIWCKRNTKGYNGVDIQNFHTSWRDGLAFCALVHKFHPESINFEALTNDNPSLNLQQAFDAAGKLGTLTESCPFLA